MVFRFGVFELDTEVQQLRRSGRNVRLQPQPYKLLVLLTRQAGRLVTREEIRTALWPADTFVDYDQGVNFAMKQVREALKEDADNPIYIETVPKRGYRFIAPVETSDPANPILPPPVRSSTDLNLQKVLWTNIAELRIAETERLKKREAIRTTLMYAGLALVVVVIVAAAIWWRTP
jgi:DNA-binding winged helix-turn-helix (wHTH) protein